jgi:hypothetical protein
MVTQKLFSRREKYEVEVVLSLGTYGISVYTV